MECSWTRYDIYYKEIKIHKSLRFKTFLRLWDFYSNYENDSQYFWCIGYDKHDKRESLNEET